MLEDAELLGSYSGSRSEAAFAELVRRHVDLVYSVALRQVGGDAHLAEDVTQTVFTALAQNPTRLRRRAALSGWLYRCARNKAVDAVRTERRRRIREQEAQMRHELEAETTEEADWNTLRPLLDEAIGQLRDTDRDAVCLRFFEGRSLAEVAARLQLTENAARMRVNRAVERLRTLLLRRKVTSTATALAAALSGQLSTAAPAGLAGKVATTALAHTVSSAAVGATVLTSMKATHVILGSAALIVLTVGSIALYQTSAPRESQDAVVGARQAQSLARQAPGQESSAESSQWFLDRLERISAIDRTSERHYRYQQLFASMTADGAPMLLAKLVERQAQWDWEEMMHHFFVRWGELDGATALATVRESKLGNRAGFTATVLSGWAKVAPESAWQMTVELAQHWPQLASEVHRVMGELVRQDLEQAIAKHNDISSPEGQRAILRAVIEFAAATDDFGSVLTEVAKFESLDEQKTWIRDIFTNWGSTGSDGAVDAISRISNPALATEALSGYLTGWVLLDPVAAVNYLVANREEPTTARMIPNLARDALQIASRDEALGMVRHLAAEDALESRMLIGITANDPLFAMSIVEAVSDPEFKAVATMEGMSLWINRDFEAAADYFEQMPNDEIKFRTLKNIATQTLMYADGGEKIRRWIEAMPAEGDRARAVEVILEAAKLPPVPVSHGSLKALATLVEQTSGLSQRARSLSEKVLGVSPRQPSEDRNP